MRFPGHNILFAVVIASLIVPYEIRCARLR